MIYVFGDSIARGILGFGWANRLKINFLKQGIWVSNLSFRGADSESIQRMVKGSLRGQGHIALFAIGMKDSQLFNGMPRTPQDRFSQNLNRLVDLARNHARRIAFIGLTRVNELKTNPVWWSRKRAYRNGVIERYDSVIKEVCRLRSVPYISLYELFSGNSALLFDGIHPNAKGHRKIFEAVRSTPYLFS